MGVTPKVYLLEHTPAPEKVIAAAAKLCYSKSDAMNLMDNLTEEKADEFVNMLNNIGHASPFEHVTFSFSIEGISRACSHQIVRHRIASYSQQSQRYVKLDQFKYVIPPTISKDPIACAEFEKHMEQSQATYDKLVYILMLGKLKQYCNDKAIAALDTTDLIKFKEYIQDQKEFSKMEKQCIEDSRYVFPNACETKLVMTMNIRSLWNFINERCCERAQWEIRHIATQILGICKEVSPSLFRYAGKPCINGICPENDMQCERGKALHILTKREAEEIINNFRIKQKV
jgi:thymidylate synthase (FAD)